MAKAKEDPAKHPWMPHVSEAGDGDREHVLDGPVQGWYCWCDPRIEVVNARG